MVTPGIAGFHRLAGASPGSSATLRGPVRRSYSGAIDTRQLPAACARSAGVSSTCMSLSASANVAGLTSGPTEGPVPKAGGMPGGAGGEGGVGGAWGWASALVAGTRAALARPRAEVLRKSRRAVLMGRIVRHPGRAGDGWAGRPPRGSTECLFVPFVWYSSGMKAAIDKAGRVVIPSEIRRRAGLRPGTEMEIILEDDASVRLVRDTPGPRLHRVGRRLVARPTAKRDRLPEVDVVALLEEERSRWPW